MVTRATNDLHLVRCTSGDVTVGLEVNRIAAVERGDRLARRPTDTAPGLFRTRQGEWPVFTLAGTLGGGRVTTDGQVVLCDGSRGRVGLLVDRVSPVERVPHDTVAPIPAGTGGQAAHAFSCVALTASGPLVVLAVDSLGAPDRVEAPAPLPTAPNITPRAKPGVGANRLLTFGRADRPGGRAVVMAVPVASVAEVFDAPPGAQLPGAADHVRELVVWRERPLVVIDAARWVGLSSRPTTSRRVVVIRSGEHALGAFAGSAVQVLAGTAMCVVSRRRVSLNRTRVSAAIDTSDLTVVIPNWAQLLGGRTAVE